ncbi:hypothetical protein [Nonomuraea sp. NPDC049504]|uniref:hypothetical protein n=1 Tax=Nonomuraea sp. NPDC049504 TaxID=3154729 RepID=UPI003440A3CF
MAEKNTGRGASVADLVRGWVDGQPELLVETQKNRRDKYGRMLATLRSGPTGVSLNELLLPNGLAEPYDRGPCQRVSESTWPSSSGSRRARPSAPWPLREVAHRYSAQAERARGHASGRGGRGLISIPQEVRDKVAEAYAGDVPMADIVARFRRVR